MADAQSSEEESLQQSVIKLTVAVEILSSKYNRARVTNGIQGVILIVLATFVALYYFVELPDRRAAIEDSIKTSQNAIDAKIRDLACAAVRARPPGFSATYDAIRQQYGCGPYDPTQVPDTNRPRPSSSASTPSGTSGSSQPSRPRRSGQSSSRPSSPAATVTRTKSAEALPAPTRTVIRPAPSRTASPRATSTPSRNCVVLNLVCLPRP